MSMKVGLPHSLEKAGVGPAHREVAPQRTPATRADLRSAIRRALEHAEGARPPEQLVDVLTAHASLETASGDKMYNFNFAGIKGRSPAGATAVCRTREVIGGHDVVIRDGFRAYATIDEGARDYVRTMKAQFSGALAPAARGDVSGFASALKRAHYYTASEADYARGLTSLMSAPGGAASTATHTSASSSLPSLPFAATNLSSSGLSRVSDALDAERWLGAMPSSFGSSSRAHSASDDDDDS